MGLFSWIMILNKDCPAVLCTLFLVLALPIILTGSEEEECSLLVWVSLVNVVMSESVNVYTDVSYFLFGS